MAKEKEDNKLDAVFVHNITSLLMQQIRAYEEQILILQGQCSELQAKLELLQNIPLDQINITVSQYERRCKH